MRGLLSREIEQYGFICHCTEKDEMYYLTTGKTTTLYIIGSAEPHDEYEDEEEFYYTFFKEKRWQENAEIETYADHLDLLQMAERVHKYMANRARYITTLKNMELRKQQKERMRYEDGIWK